jgi:hypothetical protein
LRSTKVSEAQCSQRNRTRQRRRAARAQLRRRARHCRADKNLPTHSAAILILLASQRRNRAKRVRAAERLTNGSVNAPPPGCWSVNAPPPGCWLTSMSFTTTAAMVGGSRCGKGLGACTPGSNCLAAGRGGGVRQGSERWAGGHARAQGGGQTRRRGTPIARRVLAAAAEPPPRAFWPE